MPKVGKKHFPYTKKGRAAMGTTTIHDDGITSIHDNDVNFAIGCQFNSGTPNSFFYIQVEGDTAFTGGDVGTWVHVAVTVDVSAGDTGCAIYKDGSSAKRAKRRRRKKK